MRIAILSDIHGNYFALIEVLKDAKTKKVDKLFILGDYVGYYYDPDVVLELLSDWDCELIKGNHECILSDLLSNKIDMNSIIEKYGSGHIYAIQKLIKEEQSKLINLPDVKEISLDRISFLLAHGTPWDINTYVYPDSSNSIIDGFNNYKFDFIFIGHSHYPFSIKLNDSILINPGSVGQSRQKGGIASWVLLDTQNKSFQFVNSIYDTKPLKQKVESIDFSSSYNYKILER